MKRTVTLAAAAIVIAASLTLPAWASPAVADAPLIVTMARGEHCRPTSARHFQYRNGKLVIKSAAGTVYKVTNAAGMDVTARATSLPSGIYVATFATPAGSVVSVLTITAARPCGRPATKVKEGAWKVTTRTAHRVTLSRSVKTTHYQAALVTTADGTEGEWKAKVTTGYQTATSKG